MGVEYKNKNGTNMESGEFPVVLGLQPSALIDHVAKVHSSLLDKIPGESGGSFPVEKDELEYVLREVKSHILTSPDDSTPVKSMAGGSVANTIRGLAAGFGISCGMIGGFGDDEQGKAFMSNMSFYGVNHSGMRIKKESTAQCVCLVDEMGNRTMRPNLSNSARIQPDELTREDFKGSKWLVLRYAVANMDNIQAAIHIAKQEGVLVSLDLASFEMVRKFRTPLLKLLESGGIDLCFANEDEAAELLRGEAGDGPQVALEFLAKHCQWAVVTLASNGCIAKHGKEIVRVQATGESNAIDATGAGDLFASGFLYGLITGLSLEDCCKVGSCSGGSVIRALGGEVAPENWQWMYKQMRNRGLTLPSDTKWCPL